MVRLHAHDDGRGAEAANAGNGLRGMRERLAAYGGRVSIQTAQGRGFSLDIELPLDDGVASTEPQALPAAIPSALPARSGLATGTSQ